MSVGERVSLSAGEDGHAVNHEEAPAAPCPGGVGAGVARP